MYSKVSTKYRVKKLLNSLPAEDRDLAMKELPDTLGISRQTFSKILNARSNNSWEPAAGTLIKLATFLNCPVEELLTVKPESITIDQLRIQQTHTTAKELSLTKGA